MKLKLVPKEVTESEWQKHKEFSYLRLHKPTGIWYVRAKQKGKKPLFKSLRTKKAGEAQTLAKLRLAEWMGTRTADQSGINFEHAANWVLKNYTPKQRSGTQYNHNLYIGQLIEMIGHLDVNSIDMDTLDEVISQVVKTKRVSPSGKRLPVRRSFSDYAKYMNLVMKFAYKKRWSSHLVKFSNPDRAKETGRLLSRREVTALWDAMNEDTRDQFVLALECLMRLREALCAPWAELNLESGEWTLSADRVKTGSKTGKGRSFIISPNALARMRTRHEKMQGKSVWIFPSPKDDQKPIWSTKTAWKNAKKNAGIQGQCRWHDLRHTGLTWVLLGDPDATAEQRKKMIRNPLMVSAYAGVSMKTIQSVYLKKRASQSVEVGEAVKIY